MVTVSKPDTIVARKKMRRKLERIQYTAIEE